MSKTGTTQRRHLSNSSQGSYIDREYDIRVAALKKARGALAHHGAALTRYMKTIKKQRVRKLPSLLSR